ncbi:Zn-dependent hydrolase [Desertibaculum subflavum]|uniref:Zn-dependent hydrolase n=1 Tax=Desertibaculum subflavum TaxID=2268458 RepID=UPI000E6613C5
MSSEIALKVAQAVDENRLWQRLMTMARHGATPKGGVNRQALSAEDRAARAELTAWATKLGFAVAQDDAANLYVRRAGTEAEAPPVVTGSHLDSQPTGGKFDGAYGVLAGFEVLEALERAGIKTKRPIEVVAWTNEEGSRFQPGAMGSAIYAGKYRLPDHLNSVDRDGVALGPELAATLKALDVPRRPIGGAVTAYVEAHIEQGPILESQQLQIGAVTLVQGSRRYTIEVTGEEAHAGTTPLKLRKDAMKAAAAIVLALEQAFDDPTDTVRYTVGRFDVFPGSANTVPGRVFFTIDFRHPDRATLTTLTDKIEGIAKANARGCEVKVTRISDVSPTPFDPAVIGLVRASAAALNMPSMEMISGAGHDAMHIAHLCPTGMVFVPCARGISHNEVESATPADLAAGARVLAATLVELANR